MQNNVYLNEFGCTIFQVQNNVFYKKFGCTIFQVQNNVCYNSFGHGFFLEDGGEKRTRLEGNLGLGQQAWKGLIGDVGTTGTIPTDR